MTSLCSDTHFFLKKALLALPVLFRVLRTHLHFSLSPLFMFFFFWILVLPLSLASTPNMARTSFCCFGCFPFFPPPALHASGFFFSFAAVEADPFSTSLLLLLVMEARRHNRLERTSVVPDKDKKKWCRHQHQLKSLKKEGTAATQSKQKRHNCRNSSLAYHVRCTTNDRRKHLFIFFFLVRRPFFFISLLGPLNSVLFCFLFLL
jgi:hypothetical protein